MSIENQEASPQAEIKDGSASLAGASRPKNQIECGDVYYADHGQSSHAYPTLWMVCSSASALEPNGASHDSEDCKWICLKSACGGLPLFRRGMSQAEWYGHNYPEHKHILYPRELRGMVYVGNFCDWCEAVLGAAQRRGEAPAEPQQDPSQSPALDLEALSKALCLRFPMGLPSAAYREDAKEVSREYFRHLATATPHPQRED